VRANPLDTGYGGPVDSACDGYRRLPTSAPHVNLPDCRHRSFGHTVSLRHHRNGRLSGHEQVRRQSVYPHTPAGVPTRHARKGLPRDLTTSAVTRLAGNPHKCRVVGVSPEAI